MNFSRKCDEPHEYMQRVTSCKSTRTLAEMLGLMGGLLYSLACWTGTDGRYSTIVLVLNLSNVCWRGSVVLADMCAQVWCFIIIILAVGCLSGPARGWPGLWWGSGGPAREGGFSRILCWQNCTPFSSSYSCRRAASMLFGAH